MMYFHGNNLKTRKRLFKSLFLLFILINISFINNLVYGQAFTISANTGTTICQGTNVTFSTSASPTGLIWKRNGNQVAAGTNTFSINYLTNLDQIICTRSSPAGTSNIITMTVNAQVAPSVTISSSAGLNVCTATSVIFTANANFSGNVTSYQWKVNGSNFGTNQNTFTTSLAAGYPQVTCVVTHNSGACVSYTPVTSNTLSMVVTQSTAVSASITASPGNNVACGTNVTYTATPTTGGGLTPSYQWKKNGANVGYNSNTYTGATSTTVSTSNINNNDKITCVITYSGGGTCVSGSPATSNQINMTVPSPAPVSVSIVASPNTTVCTGTNVTFTATPSTTNPYPSFQWKKNGINVGTGSNNYSATAGSGLSNNDVVTCVATYSGNCISGSPAISNSFTMTVTSLTIPVVSVTTPNTSVCNGATVVFTATSSLSNSNYQWKKNGSNVGSGGATYSATASTTINSSNINNNDVITCEVTASGACASTTPVTSSGITMQVSVPVTPTVSIAGNLTNPLICDGDAVTFTATYTNGGAAPHFDWIFYSGTINEYTLLTHTATVTTTFDIFQGNHPVLCKMTSTPPCSTTVTSNTLLYTKRPTATWMGTVSSDWHTAGNWCQRFVPTSLIDVYINSGVPHMPIISNNDAVCQKLTINSGASLQLNNHNLTVTGNWVNNGTYTTNNGTNIFAGNTIVSGTSTNTFNNISITSSAVLTTSSLTNVTGNWLNSGNASSFNNNNGVVDFTGSNAQTISGPNIFSGLKIDKASNNLLLNSATTVSGTLNLTMGKITTSSTNILTLSDNATVTGTPSNSSFVEGPLKKVGDDAFSFPIGKVVYRPVSMSAPALNTSGITVEYYNSTPPNINQTAGLEVLSGCEYWKVDQVSGSSPIQLTFNWSTNPCEGIKETLLQVMQLVNTNSSSVWNNVTASVNIPVKTAITNSLSTLGYFTFGYKVPITYAELTQKLDAGFYIADKGNLFVQYKEEYSNPSANPSTNPFRLNYKILDFKRNVVTSSVTTSLSKQTGINQIEIPLSYCSYIDGQYYILEVTDEKNDNSYLRFKYVKPSITVTCP